MRQIKCELIESRRGKYVRKARNTNKNLGGPRQNLNGNDTTSPRNSHRGSSTETPSVRASSQLRDGVRQASTQDQINKTDTQQNQGLPDQHIEGNHVQTNLPDSYADDSSTLHYVIELSHRPEGGSTEPLTVHHPIPASIAVRPGTESNQLETPVSLQEALTLPTSDILRRLIYTFFDKIHPAYPVFDRERFTQLYSTGQASPMVLQTMCLLGFTIGSDELILAAGFTDRATARKTHFLRAKALYDADYESDRMNLAAVMLLFGFWWAGPDDQKDTCHWVGCAVSYAQSLGMHRSLAQSSMSPRMKSLRKRLWWIIYTRDRHVSGAFGRPCRIRDEDCDIEALTEEDFHFDTAFDQHLIPVQKDYHVSYVLEMIKLASILGDILIGEFSPRRPHLEKYEAHSLTRRLDEWEMGLPNILKIKAHEEYTNGSFWGCMLQISLQNCIILLFRPKSVKEGLPAEAGRDSRARAAADHITRLAEDLLATGMIHSGLIHMVPALFSALSIHTLVICRKESIHRQLAENKSRQCMLALSVIAKSWPVRIWISKAFVNLMKRLTGQGSNLNGPIVNVSSSIWSPSNDTAPSTPSQMGVRIQPITSQFPPNNIAPISHCTCNIGSDPTSPHAPGCLWRAPDQFIHDSLWAGYLDNALDVDLFLHDGTGFTQYMSFESANIGGPSTLGDI